jgi:Fe-S-cluster-containing dehydrogenase component
MTALPASTPKKLGLLIDLDICVGCHACAVSCKEWNDGGQFGPLTDGDARGADPLGVWFNRVHSYTVEMDRELGIGDHPENHRDGTSLPRSHVVNSGGSVLPKGGPIDAEGMSLHFPRSCLHCENAACVTVCPTGASYKRAEDGIVLVDYDKCIGCKLCSWACPYGAREYDQQQGVMKKCTLCVDRIYNETLAQEDRQPACVLACPTGARLFGDFADADSEVSKRTRERDGRDLMADLGYAPTNKYLAPRPRQRCADGPAAPLATEALPPVLRWLDRMLSR